MSKLPILSPRKLRKILEKIGFILIRQEGSHMFFRYSDGRTTIIPNHPCEDIDRGLLNKIIRKDLRIEREEFMKYL